ncbi:MAG: Ig-like domain-containing protein, partial [Planctomycetaceae bacterium]
QFESLGVEETGTDTFTYTISDGNGGTSTADVTVTINGANDPPQALGCAASHRHAASLLSPSRLR